MKIRSGFVSNSSSSSFILIFDRMPESVEDLIKMLTFRGASAEFTREEYAQRIFNDIQGGPPDDEELLSLFGQDLYLQTTDLYRDAYKEKDKEKREELYKAIHKYEDDLKASKLKKFKENTSGKVIRTVIYSDNDGFFDSNLEHGGLFDNIEHVYINQH